MKLLAISVILFLGGLGLGDTPIKTQNEEKPAVNQHKVNQMVAFNPGEKYLYSCSYGMLNAGEAWITMDSKLHRKNNTTCYKVDINGYVTGVASMMYTLEDRWTSYMDTSSLLPQEFQRKIREGNYRHEEKTLFDHKNNSCKVKGVVNGNKKQGKYDIPEYTLDMISGYYQIRKLDFDNYSSGDTIVLTGFLEDKVYDLEIIYLGESKVKTKLGEMNSYVISPILPKNAVFSGKNAVKLWISKDLNRVPVKIKASLIVGSVVVELEEHHNTFHQFAIAE